MKSKYEKEEELRTLARRINSEGAKRRPKNIQEIEQFYSLALELNQAQAIDDALIEKGFFLLDQGRLCEALLVFEQRLQTAPYEYSAQANWKTLRQRVFEQMEMLADSDPETPEFGRTYEQLRDIGFVSTKLHKAAVYHYLASNRIHDAERIMLALIKTYPGSPGMKDLIFKLSEKSDETEIQKFRLKLVEAK